MSEQRLPAKNELTMQQLQEDVDVYIRQFKEGYFEPFVMLARLTEETGELAREITHHYGPKKKKADEADSSIEMELGDLLFILACFANSMNLDLAEAHRKVMHKFHTRDANRWTRVDSVQEEIGEERL